MFCLKQRWPRTACADLRIRVKRVAYAALRTLARRCGTRCDCCRAPLAYAPSRSWRTT